MKPLIYSTDDASVLKRVVSAVKAAAMAVQARYNVDARPENRRDIEMMIASNDALSNGILRELLSADLPGAQWIEDEEETGRLPPGEWWITDPVEGAINHIQGLPDWGVTATLVRDNETVLTAVHLPVSGETYTALRGRGAWLNGRKLYTSSKAQLNAAIVGTGQAKPEEGEETHRRLGLSVIAMLEAALVVRVSVPATLQLVQIAAGRQDIFWQYSQVRSGLLAGALLVAEAGGCVTDLEGAPWHLESRGLIASNPALSSSAVAVLSQIV